MIVESYKLSFCVFICAIHPAISSFILQEFPLSFDVQEIWEHIKIHCFCSILRIYGCTLFYFIPIGMQCPFLNENEKKKQEDSFLLFHISFISVSEKKAKKKKDIAEGRIRSPLSFETNEREPIPLMAC